MINKYKNYYRNSNKSQRFLIREISKDIKDWGIPIPDTYVPIYISRLHIKS